MQGSFHSSAVYLAMSSPTFLGERPKGLILGTRELAANDVDVHVDDPEGTEFWQHVGGGKEQLRLLGAYKEVGFFF